MKKIILTASLLIGLNAFAQDHFSGISTSNRVGILNANVNPAELANLSKKFEVNIYGLSFNVANNKIAFSDISSDADFETLIFQGSSPVNARIDAEIMGPGVAMRWKKWGFAITTKAYAKFDMIDIDPTIGNAITNDNIILNTTLLNNPNNQRLSGTSYGEVGLSAARTFFENDNHKFSAGVTLKILFPGSYSNFGLSNLNGEINETLTGAFLHTNSPANLNIAYSGNLADSFTNFDDYSKSIFGGLNGFAGDIGFNYQWKKGKDYKLNAGLAIRNIGTMTFKDDNNASTNYVLNIPQSDPLDLSLFDDVENLGDVETILRENGYLTEMPQENDFKVKLPTVLSTYVDFKLVSKFYVTAYLQQKVNEDSDNDQITVPNIFSITPRVNLGFFETYVPVTFNEISGTNVGLGFRLGGFYLGTSSLVTALVSDSKQGDIYTGFRWAFL
ncbi:hypothetical protein IVB69_13665 [Flavobacterium sp. J49]|uniref:DUF5723 family protein n=1 Tax=Flavobacterium sp. J49 TaxID=2718534 RepID=UPI001592B714|nr:hypothetical protein [Flavobacterium sp. J49]MBF6642534.1 hypothetical protein [Flavobacterium sp. J49]NIC03780.1 hypothetical protein [Flavobacterium sp. J49]